MDCESPDAVNTASYGVVLKFLNKSWEFWEFIDGSLTCLKGQKDVLTELIKLFPAAEKFIKNAINKTLTFSANLLAQILSAGIWGFIRGTYQLLRMGYLIYKLVTEFKDDLPLKTGLLLGIGIRAASTYLFEKKII